MRFPFVVHPQGKWRKNRRKTGVWETVAKISWHVPIFMKVSASVTRDSSLSSRSSFRNVPRLTYSSSPLSARVFPSTFFATWMSFQGDQTPATQPCHREIGFLRSRFEAIVFHCVLRFPSCDVALLLLLLPPSAQN